MARAYSDDLRRKLLEAHDQGQASLVELAERFGVSRGWAWKISAARRRSGQMERRRYRPGPSSRLNQEALAGLLARHADWTLRQLQAGLEKQTGDHFSTAYLWMVLKRMRFRLKKVTPRHRAGQRSQPDPASGVPRKNPRHPVGELDLSGRKRCHHADDTALCAGPGRHTHP